MKEKINEVGNRVFLKPKPLLSYEYLVRNSLAANTYRGFHKIDKNKPGASVIFRKFLLGKKEYINEKVLKAKDEEQLSEMQNNLCNELRELLKVNIKNDQLESYNKLRKPIDIVIQHMVAMSDFIEETEREQLTALLFLPLDSLIFQSDFVFSDEERKDLDIKKIYTFRNIETPEHYNRIQEFLKNKAKKIGINHRIYFDLVWNNRYNSRGTNLFGTNPERQKK